MGSECSHNLLDFLVGVTFIRMTEYEVHVSAPRCRHPPRLARSVSSSLRG